MLKDFFESNGVVNASEIILDGKLHRVDHRDKPGKKTAWYVGWEVPQLTCVLGDWRTGQKLVYKEGKKKNLSRQEMKEVNRAIQERRAIEDKERAEAQTRAAIEARAMWAKAQPDCKHTYLEKKQVENYGLRKLDGTLLVPMHDKNGELFGIQRIYEDGGKFFLKGQRTTDLFYKIQGDDSVTYFCEGYATGATIHEITGMTTVIAFNSGNLKRLGKLAGEIAKGSEIIFCADNDTQTEGNPGITAAAEAAKLAHAQYCYPVFKDPKDGTDFNDLAAAEGEEAVLRCLGELLGKPKTYVPLGSVGQGGCFYNYRTLSVVRFTTWSNAELYQLLRREEWQALYPKKDDDKGGGGFDSEQVKSDLVNLGSKVGPFDPFRVRGPGVWLDEGRAIVNTGDTLYVDRLVVPHQDLKSKFVYVSGKRLIPPPVNPASVMDLAHLVSALNLMRWQKPAQKFYFGGWLAISRIAGALPIRPHLWLTGSSGSGKSTLLERIVSPLIGAHSEHVLGATTEAGLRQSLQYASMPIIFDEFESNNSKQSDRVSAVIELLRHAWSPTKGTTVKGSAGGVAQGYHVQSPALVSSIKVNLTNEADQSRFTEVELIKGNDPAQWESVKACLTYLTEELGDKMFARMVNMIPTVIESYGVAKSYLQNHDVSSRLSDQYGMLLAGYFALTQDGPIREDQLSPMLADIHVESGDRVKDEVMALTTLLQQTVELQFDIRDKLGQTEGDPNTIKATIGQFVHGLDDGKLRPYVNDLTRYGVKLEDGYLYFANSSPWIAKVLSQWPNWPKTLRRLPGVKTDVVYMSAAGTGCRAQAVPLKLLKTVIS